MSKLPLISDGQLHRLKRVAAEWVRGRLADRIRHRLTAPSTSSDDVVSLPTLSRDLYYDLGHFGAYS